MDAHTVVLGRVLEEELDRLATREVSTEVRDTVSFMKARLPAALKAVAAGEAYDPIQGGSDFSFRITQSLLELAAMEEAQTSIDPILVASILEEEIFAPVARPVEGAGRPISTASLPAAGTGVGFKAPLQPEANPTQAEAVADPDEGGFCRSKEDLECVDAAIAAILDKGPVQRERPGRAGPQRKLRRNAVARANRTTSRQDPVTRSHRALAEKARPSVLQRGAKAILVGLCAVMGLVIHLSFAKGGSLAGKGRQVHREAYTPYLPVKEARIDGQTLRLTLNKRWNSLTRSEFDSRTRKLVQVLAEKGYRALALYAPNGRQVHRSAFGALD